MIGLDEKPVLQRIHATLDHVLDTGLTGSMRERLFAEQFGGSNQFGNIPGGHLRLDGCDTVFEIQSSGCYQFDSVCTSFHALFHTLVN